jgi:SAM-dependent methyltransferase
MAPFEDHFSQLAREYARYRPEYPPELFTWLASISPRRELAWDCGTGNGQAARRLVGEFKRVIATDASAQQIAEAPPDPRILYRAEPAEGASLDPGSVDLVTAAASLHWFDLEQFYGAVRRAAAPGGILAAWGYHFPVITPQVDEVIARYYSQVLGPYWPPQMKALEEHYRTLPFPFDELEPPEFEMQADWTLEQFAGFASSWSASGRYLQDRGGSPIAVVWDELSAAWGGAGARKHIRWPLYFRVGHVSRRLQ